MINERAEWWVCEKRMVVKEEAVRHLAIYIRPVGKQMVNIQWYIQMTEQTTKGNIGEIKGDQESEDVYW